MNQRSLLGICTSPQRLLELAGVRAPMRMVMGLALLTTCVLLFAEDIKLLPSEDEQLMRARVNLAEVVSRSIAAAVSGEDYVVVNDQLNALVGHNDVLSACLRKSDGFVVAQTADHQAHWAAAQGDQNDLTHIHLTLSAGATPWGRLEIAFSPPPEHAGWRGWWSAPMVRVVIFVVLALFVLFWLYLSRMLTMLDPSSVIPNRMQLLMDTLVEGMVVLDNRGFIVMANQAIAQTAFSSAEQLVGRRLSTLPWLANESDEPPPSFPWENEGSHDLQLRGVPIRLRIGVRDARRLNVNVSPILEPSGKRRGVIVTFDDLTVVDQDNLQLSKILARFGDATDQIHELRDQLPSKAGRQLDQLEELAQSARELAQLCATATDTKAVTPISEEISDVNRHQHAVDCSKGIS